MSTPDGIPRSCQGRCPLERLNSELISEIPFTLNCDGPKPVSIETDGHEFDISNDGTMTRLTGQDRKMGEIACTNDGARIYVEEHITEV